jgi:membrane protein
MEWAAALSFYGTLSLFPLVLAGAGLASYVVDPHVIGTRLSVLVEGVLPAEVLDVEPIVATAIAARGRLGLVAFALWLLAGRRILGALVTAIDRVSDVDARQESVKRRAVVEMIFLTAIGVLFLVALTARPLIEWLWVAVSGNATGSSWVWATGSALHTLLLVGAFFALYTIVPHGERNRRAAFIGAIVATGLFLLARAVFLALLGRLWESYSIIYGPLALAALLLSWGWILGLIILFGASLASHVKVMVIEGGSTEDAERRHVAHKAAA